MRDFEQRQENLQWRIIDLEARATKQSADNNAALSEVATLKERVAALEAWVASVYESMKS